MSVRTPSVVTGALATADTRYTITDTTVRKVSVLGRHYKIYIWTNTSHVP